MFLCELSMTLCLSYKTKCSDRSSDTTRDAIKNKPSTCSLRWDPSDICTKTQTRCLNQTRQSKRSINPFVPTTDPSACLYTVSSVEKIVPVIVISICSLAFSMIKCQPLSDWTQVGGAYSEKMAIRRCLALEAVFMQMTAPRWHQPWPSDPKRVVFGAWLNKCVLKLAGCFNSNSLL